MKQQAPMDRWALQLPHTPRGTAPSQTPGKGHSNHKPFPLASLQAHGGPSLPAARCFWQAEKSQNERHCLHLGARSTPAPLLSAALTPVCWLWPGLAAWVTAGARPWGPDPTSHTDQTCRDRGGRAPTRLRAQPQPPVPARTPQCWCSWHCELQDACHDHAAWLHRSLHCVR